MSDWLESVEPPPQLRGREAPRWGAAGDRTPGGGAAAAVHARARLRAVPGPRCCCAECATVAVSCGGLASWRQGAAMGVIGGGARLPGVARAGDCMHDDLHDYLHIHYWCTTHTKCVPSSQVRGIGKCCGKGGPGPGGGAAGRAVWAGPHACLHAGRVRLHVVGRTRGSGCVRQERRRLGCSL